MANFLTDTHQLLISRFSQINRLVAQMLETKLAPLGISYQEMRIAGLLMGEEDITQKELADKLSVRAATLSVAISRLEKQGLVTRVASKTDKRVNYLRLNPGEKITQVESLLGAMEINITHGISKKDLKTTSAVLTHIMTNLRATDSLQDPL